MIAQRTNADVLYRSFAGSMVTALLGPRRVGKTTLCRAYLEQSPDILWVVFNLDLLDEQELVRANRLQEAIEQRALQRIGGARKIWVFIDEAQKSSELFEQIKVLYDLYKGRDVIKFILTGSALLSLHKLSAESLAGRVELFRLRAFSIRESCAFVNKVDLPNLSIFDAVFAHENLLDRLPAIIGECSPFKAVLSEALRHELVWGGLPEILDCDDAARIKYLSGYLQTYLEKDVRALETITDLQLYRQLINVLAQQTGAVKNDQRIVEALGSKRDTINKYRGFLQATLFYEEIYPFIDSSLKRLVKSPKGYLKDNGLISYLMDIYDINILEKTGIIGARFENWFLNELEVALDRDPRVSGIYYWRTSSGAEVDFIVKRGAKCYPFEITYSAQIIRSKVRNLRTFMADENITCGFYIYNGDYHYDAEAKIYFIPGWVVG
ncbi:MAG: ATP-binding protein [Gammaproteobacteria bacterium]|nr:ATP-binding protein [Gammaproteobacteria bacterium]